MTPVLLDSYKKVYLFRFFKLTQIKICISNQFINKCFQEKRELIRIFTNVSQKKMDLLNESVFVFSFRENTWQTGGRSMTMWTRNGGWWLKKWVGQLTGSKTVYGGVFLRKGKRSNLDKENSKLANPFKNCMKWVFPCLN